MSNGSSKKKTSSPGVANATHVKTEAGGYAQAHRDGDVELVRPSSAALAEFNYATRRDHRAALTGVPAALWKEHVAGCVACASEEVVMAAENLRLQRNRSRNDRATVAAETRLRNAADRLDATVDAIALRPVPATDVDGPTETFEHHPEDKSLLHGTGRTPRPAVASPEIRALRDALAAAAPELSPRLAQALDEYEEDVAALGELTRDEQLAVLAHRDPNVRVILVGRQIGEDIQMALLHDEDWTIRAAIAKSPLSAPATLRAAYEQRTVEMHYALARNPSTPRDILWNIVTNPNEAEGQRTSARGVLLWRDALAERGEEYDPRSKDIAFVKWDQYCWERGGTLDAPSA